MGVSQGGVIMRVGGIVGVSQGGVIRGGCVSWRDSGCVPGRGGGVSWRDSGCVPGRGNKRRGCELEG